MNRNLISLATAAVALPLLLSGCAPTAESGDSFAGAKEQLAELKRDGKVPASFTDEPSELRIEVNGDEFGIHWKGEPLTQGCTPAHGSPNSTASMMMLQDVGIEDVKQCGDIWQAKQADGSFIAWNAAE